ncbi:MAG: transcription-repair coupling factor, partial [Paracoccus sp. (in: a-proteobacteria)]|nr:transcription-repair coupling factor [Paracoccus sp. (in: a-proteobacteria)]
MSQQLILSGAPEGYDAALIAREAARPDNHGAPVIHVARDDRRMAATRAALAFMAPKLVVLDFPAWDTTPYDRVSPAPEIQAARMATLAALAQGAIKGPFVLLTSLNAVLQRVPPRDLVRSTAFTARVGDRINEEALRNFLVRMGFVQSPTVTEPGDYAIRGGIIDIFPPGESGPIRLDLFGDVLDGARRFDAATQRTTEKLTRIELAPMSEVILDEDAITRFRQNYRTEYGLGTTDPLYESVSAGRKTSGMEHWLPWFHDRMESLFDYMPDASVVLDDHIGQVVDARRTMISEQFEARCAAMKAKGRSDTVYKPVPPDAMFPTDAEWNAWLSPHRVLRLSVLNQPPGPGVLDAGGRAGRNFAPERQAESINLFGALADHIKSLRKTHRVVIASFSEGARERLS